MKCLQLFVSFLFHLRHKKNKNLIIFFGVVFDNKLKTQEYIKSPKITNKEAEILIALRSQTIRGIRSNFHTFYKSDIQCRLCLESPDTQEHCMQCPRILARFGPIKRHMKYKHIFGQIQEQKEIAWLYTNLLSLREELLQEQDDQDDEDDPDDEEDNDLVCRPEAYNTGPCTSGI